MSCAVCKTRKEKRFCLALHDRVCPQCCGEQRETTIDCPSECAYLQQARQHEKPASSEQPPDNTFPTIELKQSFVQDHEALLSGLLQSLAGMARADRQITDQALMTGLAALARSQQRVLASGLVFEESTPNPAQRAVIDTLRQIIEEFREVERKHLGYVRLKDRDIFHALVFLLRLAHVHTSGRHFSRAFIDFLQQRFPDARVPVAGAVNGGGRIIIP